MDSSVVSRLLDLSKKADKKAAVAAIQALGEGGPTSQEVIERLLELSRRSDEEIMVASISALGRIYRRRR